MTDNQSQPAALEQGIAAQRAGNLAMAEQIYAAMLAASPRHFEARHMLGVVYLQRNQFDLAEKTIGEALSVRPDEAGALANRAMALFYLGRLDETVEVCNRP